jgi:hypothetical protein
MRRHRLFTVVGGLVVAATVGLMLVGTASAAPVNHGISFTKGCASTTQVGQPYACTFSIINMVDDAQDTLTIKGLFDTVHSAGGDVPSGNVFGSLKFVIGSGSPTCTGGTGNGTAGNPFTGATSCTLPFGSRLDVLPFSHYTVKAADFALAGHVLADSAELQWNDVCDGPGNSDPSNCNPDPPNSGAGSQTIVTGLPSTTTTDIHNAAHQIVTAVPVGTTVHDLVTVSGGAGNPVPTGNVTVDWFLNGTCTLPAQSTSASTPLGPAGTADVTAFEFTVNAPAARAFRAHYAGDQFYLASDGPCEPLQVVDANVSITPNGTNPVNTTHTFTGHVNVNDGSGSANAPAGTQITFTIDSGPGSFVGGVSSCTTVGATGSCTVTITSPTPGVTTVSAHTTVSVGGVSLTRDTNGTAGNSAPAEKTWVAARIAIAPSATNGVGQPHTFTVTLESSSGGPFQPVQGAHVDVTLTDSLGAVHTAPTGTCTNAGANTNAAGQCTITFTSNTTGKVTGHATATINVGGQNLTVETNGVAPNSADAVKTFVDARISITPNGTNPVGSPHVFTAHVDVNLGDGNGFVPAPNGTQISFSIASGPGTISASPCTTGGGTGSCTATLTSATAGTTVVNASTTISVGGVTLTRTTNGTAGNSGPATKIWVDTAVRTDIHNAAHAVITTAQPGDVVHDKVFVTKAPGTPAAAPNPTGQVTFHRYSTIDCTGAAVDETVSLAADGTAETGTFTVTGDMSYKADYLGSALYPARSGACEPLSVQPVSVCPSCPPPPCPAFPVFPGQPGPGGPCSFDVLDRSVKGTLVEITIQNNSSNGDAAMTALHISWPASNGALKSVVLDGQLYSGPALTGGSADLTFTTIPLTRTIKVGQSEKLRLIFEKNADTNTSHYGGSVEFGTCNIAIF